MNTPDSFPDDTLPLFPDASGEPSSTPASMRRSGDDSGGVPLAERMRPRTLEEVVGQAQLLGEEGLLRRLLEAKRLPSLILHGPPGSGKTTLARLVAERLEGEFVPFSAVSEGVPRLREVVKQAEFNRKNRRRTLLFIDEIHRLNKGQQDFLLPHVEAGLLTLIGATTEHPAFEVNAALLSRSRVLVLEPLSEEELRLLIDRAAGDPERGLGAMELKLGEEGAALIAHGAAGDARKALVTLEIAAELAGAGGELTLPVVEQALQQRISRYDTTVGYEMLSAFHKSLRASSGSGALYWAMRMIRSGEDPLVLFRRLIAAAYEDVGLADPQAGIVSVQAMQAFERLGAPEGYLPLANAILYVANAAKSNRAYEALHDAMEAAEQHPDAAVPLHLRNAATGLMRSWGYGQGYRYAHSYEGGYAELQCLPDELADATFYKPTDRGYERKVAERMRERGQLKE